MTVLLGAGALVAVLWGLLALLLPRVIGRVPRLCAGEAPSAPVTVSVVVPARNEAQLLPRCLAALAEQRRLARERLQIVVVDDGSTDGTAQAARAQPGVALVAPGERPAGWAGKCWAAWQGALRARGEWLLFLDADAVLEPDCLAAALALAERERADLLAALPRAACDSAWEAILQPVLLFLLLWRLDPRRVNDPDDPAAAAPGSFLLFRRSAYERLGGHEAVRGEVVDDLKLAERVKQAGLRLVLARAADLVTTRRRLGFGELWNGWSRVAVEGVGRRAAVALLGALALLCLFVGPEALAPLGPRFAALAGAHLLFGRIVRAELRKGYGVDDRWAWLQPLGALLAAALLLRAAAVALGARGRVRWRGRDYVA